MTQLSSLTCPEFPMWSAQHKDGQWSGGRTWLRSVYHTPPQQIEWPSGKQLRVKSSTVMDYANATVTTVFSSIQSKISDDHESFKSKYEFLKDYVNITCYTLDLLVLWSK